MPPNPNNRNRGKDTVDVRTEGESERTADGDERSEKKKSVSSLVDELLSDIYGKTELKRRQSLTTGGEISWHESDQRNRPNLRFRSNLKQIEAKCWSKDVVILREEISALKSLVAEESNNLVKYLKRKDFLLAKREAHYDVITAVIHAISKKTRDDMKMKFSLTPGAETGFSQWLDAMKMVAQLPGGVPSEFRTKLWLQLSERHLTDHNIDWEKAEAIIFNEWTNPDDEELGVQIVKDLHRTGCSLFCGAQEQNQALLKRVLLAYARWNKNVGYCQGFNMLAALILQVMDRDEKNAVKVMIYLIEGVLPESYFANNLRGLSVDMAVFRDLLRLRLPKLSKHLEALQNDTNSGTSYEPPLTNVFTMQWFLTLFSNCLPQQTVLRVWDLVFLHGNEVLLRTALAIWGILQDRIMSVESADEFYSIMGVVTREMLEFGLMDANNLIKMIVMVDPFPNELQELREKYLYNISPWAQSVQSAARKGIKLFYSDPEDQDDTEDEDKIALATAYGVFRRRVSESGSRDVQPMGPTLDISVLKQQYAKLRQRQRQAHIIISAACSSSIPTNLSSVPTVSVNHLLMGKSALVNKGRRIGPPEGSIPPPKNRTAKGTEVAKQSTRKEKVVISGETLDWKDAEKRKCSTSESKKFSNTDGKLANNKLNSKPVESCNGLNKEGEHFGEDEGMKRRSSTSSASSTSTELCDDEFHRLSDFDSEEAVPEPAITHSSNPTQNTQLLTDNPSSESGRKEEIRECAAELMKDIEEAVNKSERLRHLTNPDNSNKEAEGGSLSTSNHDNIIIESPGFGDVEEEFLKTEPEVPIAGNVIDNAENRIFDRSKSRKERDRRKSDLALSVIKENLEMLSKFSQKSAMREEKSEAGNQAKKEEREGGMEEAEKPSLETVEVERDELKKCDMREEEKPGIREGSRGTIKTEVVEMLQQQNVWEKEPPMNETTEIKHEIPKRGVVSEVREDDRPKLEAIEIKSKEGGLKTDEVRDNREEEMLKTYIIHEFREKENRVELKLEEGGLKGNAMREVLGKDVIREERKNDERLMSEPTGVEEMPTRTIESEVRVKNDRPKTETMGVKFEEDVPKRQFAWEVREIELPTSQIPEAVLKKDVTRNDHETEDRLKNTISEVKRMDEGSKRDVRDVRVKDEQPESEAVEVKSKEGGLKRDVLSEILEKEERPKRNVVSEVRDDDRQKNGATEEAEPKRLLGTEAREMYDLPKSEPAEANRKRTEHGKTDESGDALRTRAEPSEATEQKPVSRVNKEVNTDITIATGLDSSPSRALEGMQKKDQGTVDEFLINLISTKSLHKSPERFKPEQPADKEPEIVRPFGREDLAERWKKESERIESKIELSKSDWELKMRRIAELENTTREKLNEMKSKSIVHRHRSLDRYDGRDREKRKSPIPRIQVPEDDFGDVERRKMKISALSFDEITSRTEKLLGANLNLDSGHRKWRKSSEEEGEFGKSYEYYSSPTSPEYRGRRHGDYSSPKRYETRWKHTLPAEEDWLTITEENGRGATIDLVSPGKRDPSPVGGFNPFPTRTHSRPKELGVRLGMYPPSPEGGHSSKRCQ